MKRRTLHIVERFESRVAMKRVRVTSTPLVLQCAQKWKSRDQQQAKGAKNMANGRRAVFNRLEQ